MNFNSLKKRFLFFFIILISQHVFSQTFVELTSISLPGGYGSVNWIDYDNDNDLDAFVSYSGIYQNDGNDVFTFVNTGITSGSCVWGDYDNDGDLDLATGSFIYRNDGNSVFTDINVSIIGLSSSALAWGDYDNDGRLDLLISGLDIEQEPIGRLYHNDGNNIFSDSKIPIVPCVDGMLKWGDYNNDNLLDILMSGLDFNGNRNTEIYQNDGNNNFVSINSNIIDGFRGCVDWGDYDNDGDLDIIMAGQWTKAQIYRNDGNNVFTKITTDLPILAYSSVAWGDYDNDGDLDFIIAGINSTTYESDTRLYQNKENSIFTEDSNVLLDISYGSLAWGDYDNDGDIDLIIGGSTYSLADDTSPPKTKIYRNDTPNTNTAPSIPTGIESKVINNTVELKWSPSTDTKTPSAGLSYNVCIGTYNEGYNILSSMSCITSGFMRNPKLGNAMQGNSYKIKNLPVGTYYWRVQAVDPNSLASQFSSGGSFEVFPTVINTNIDFGQIYPNAFDWGDYDNDGDLDLLMVGGDYPNEFSSKIYRNNGNSVFDTLNANLKGVGFGTCIWGDYDNDGDLDIFIAGNTGESPNYNPVSKIYRNNGNSTFTDINAAIAGVGFGSSDWGDYDNDGDLDILLTGTELSTIYQNHGNGVFVDINKNFTKSNMGTARWGDYDNDMDMDVLIYGHGEVEIYRNEGSNTFLPLGLNFPSYSEGSAEWGDYDNDGDLDLLMTGSYQEYNRTVIYQNNGKGGFTDIGAGLRGVSESVGFWGDFNNDGYSDVLYTGRSGSFISKICLNNRNGTFSDIYAPLTAGYRTKLSPADFDNDGDLDIISTMYREKPILYCNNMNFPNDPPTAPTNLVTERKGYGIIFRCDAATDIQSADGGLSYNLRVGTIPGGVDIISPMSDLASGYRRIPKMGNCQMNLGGRLDSLSEGTYYWSLQAIDQSFLSGPWAAEQTFTISVIRADFEADTVCLGTQTTFTDLSLTSGDPNTEWKWDFGDGNTSNLQNPIHTYTVPGTFLVKLIALSSQYSDTVTKQVIIKPKPTANFQANVVCHGDPTVFVNQTDENGLTISSWKWSFGDSQTSNQKNPDPHYYSQSGEFNAKLVATSDNGCSDSIIKPVIVAKYPVVIVFANGPVEFCEGENVLLSVEKNDAYNYQWKLNGIALSDSTRYQCGARYKGNYSVDVENTQAGCLSSSSAVNVNVVEKPVKPVVNVSGYNVDNCPEYELITMEVEESTALYSYQWKRNGVPLSNETQPIFNGYLQEGIYTVDVASGDCKISSDGINIDFNYEVPEKPDIVAHGPNIWYLACTDTTAALYKWYYNNTLIEGATRSVYVANQNLGEYKVSINISAQGNCWVTSDPLTIPIVTTGVDDPDPFANVKIYPNPTPGVFTIEMENQVYGDLNIKIVNSEVREILSIKFNKTTNHFSTQIDLSGQVKGIYLINLQIERFRATRKLVVE